jgi:leucyl aminopeptidase (aminopeptidase T)
MAEKITPRFGKTRSIPAGLRRAAKVAVREVLGTRKGERVLIVTNPTEEVQLISLALFDAALDAGAAPALMVQRVKTQMDFADDAVIQALKSEPDIGIVVTSHKLGKDRFGMKRPYRCGKKKLDHIFHYLMAAKKSRAFWSPTATVKMFQTTVPIDYRKLRRSCKRLKRILDGARKVHITTRKGTDLTLGLRGRKARADDGDFTRPGAGGNLPAGEVYISPELGSGQGVIFFDGCIASDKGVILIKEPIRAEVRDNKVARITGGREARELRATLDRARRNTSRFAKSGQLSKKDVPEYTANIFNLGELGIGLNERATIVGNMLQDEKVMRTCHIAIGSNYDEDARALVHLDGLVKRPTIDVYDGGGRARRIMEHGELQV